jgi:two-component system alkaline phosphatase synthesis response regulator PhoP
MTKIMLVEDDPTMISLLNTLLEIEGFEVVRVVDFYNVPQEIRQNQADLILMDVHLEEQDGVEVLTTVRADAEVGTVPIIMSSGMDLRDKCLRHGANDFLLKPYMPDELIEKIKKIV